MSASSASSGLAIAASQPDQLVNPLTSHVWYCPWQRPMTPLAPALAKRLLPKLAALSGTPPAGGDDGSAPSSSSSSSSSQRASPLPMLSATATSNLTDDRIAEAVGRAIADLSTAAFGVVDPDFIARLTAGAGSGGNSKPKPFTYFSADAGLGVGDGVTDGDDTKALVSAPASSGPLLPGWLMHVLVLFLAIEESTVV
jgi:hypothetical protein